MERGPVPVEEAEPDCSRLLSSDDVRELLMLLMLDMGFLLSCRYYRTVRGLLKPLSIFFCEPPSNIAFHPDSY